MQVDGRVVASSLFEIDIPLSCQHIRFCAKSTRMETDDEVELRMVFRPLELAASKELCCGKIFQVFVVSDDINCFRGTL